jgi:hypothetical protein
VQLVAINLSENRVTTKGCKGLASFLKGKKCRLQDLK